MKNALKNLYYFGLLLLSLSALLTLGCEEVRIMSEENVAQQNTAENENPSENVSIPELEAFIFKPDEFTDFIVPRRLSPPKVAQFLIQKINKNTKLEAFVQVEKVAKFYDTFEVVEKYKSFLDKSETNSEEVIRSIVITRIIAVVGDRKDWESARQYYEYLIKKINSVEEFEEIVVLHENLALGKSSASLREKINSTLKSLEASKETDYAAGAKYAKLKQSIDLKLRQAEEVQAIKDKILVMTDRKQRLAEEIKLYLYMNYGVPDFLDPWSARRLRQETWAEQPSEQMKRVDAQPYKKQVMIALRDFLTDLDKQEGLPAQDREAVKLRLLRAIKFFDGKVTEEEENLLKMSEEKQMDILANSGYLIQKQ